MLNYLGIIFIIKHKILKENLVTLKISYLKEAKVFIQKGCIKAL